MCDVRPPTAPLRAVHTTIPFLLMQDSTEAPSHQTNERFHKSLAVHAIIGQDHAFHILQRFVGAPSHQTNDALKRGGVLHNVFPFQRLAPPNQSTTATPSIALLWLAPLVAWVQGLGFRPEA